MWMAAYLLLQPTHVLLIYQTPSSPTKHQGSLLIDHLTYPLPIALYPTSRTVSLDLRSYHMILLRRESGLPSVYMLNQSSVG